MRYLIYLMIGMGLNAAIEIKKGDVLSYGERFVVVAMWPAVIAAVGFKLAIEEMPA